MLIWIFIQDRVQEGWKWLMQPEKLRIGHKIQYNPRSLKTHRQLDKYYDQGLTRNQFIQRNRCIQISQSSRRGKRFHSYWTLFVNTYTVRYRRICQIPWYGQSSSKIISSWGTISSITWSDLVSAVFKKLKRSLLVKKLSKILLKWDLFDKGLKNITLETILNPKGEANRPNVPIEPIRKIGQMWPTSSINAEKTNKSSNWSIVWFH